MDLTGKLTFANEIRNPINQELLACAGAELWWRSIAPKYGTTCSGGIKSSLVVLEPQRIVACEPANFRDYHRTILARIFRAFNMWFQALLLVFGAAGRIVASSDPLTKGPSFINEPPNRVEFSNVSGTVVSCVAESRPRPVITWVKSDGEVIHDLPGLRHIRHDGALVFPPFSPEDYRADVHAAVYRCMVSNSVGTIGSRDVHVRAGRCSIIVFVYLYKELFIPINILW
ncbi:down syndrome cell adhesion molecule-like protein Dscam2 [Nephila pilipes]|uniref:Down syndrome cell adhesion molecule-like protein Dscam2 n=1 Tax=Nephila pilipes TaxID=299642 RepID=A0A8X6R0M9_NEPPI|nr:down syndrome cell adhesion molecule-like protein Dscam2 [Nephila pilipes]